VNARDEVLARIRRANANAGQQASTRAPAAEQTRTRAPAAEQTRTRAPAATQQASTGAPAAAQRDKTSAAINGSHLAAVAERSAPSSDPAGPSYRTRGELDGAQLLDLLAGRLTDYRATVRRTDAAGLASEVVAALTERGARRMVVPAGLDLPGRDDLPPDIEIVTDGRPPGPVAEAGGVTGAGGVTKGNGVAVAAGDGDSDSLDAAGLDACDGAVTGAAVAIAETGTIVLDGSPDQGRRAITLVPDYHLCIVRAEQVVQLVPEAVARLADRAQAPLTWISGPSATSDIELERVEGVHGPRTLEVILVS
jgi:L-lactate dehydrogenase complex protein LldG